jgi:hypothetical protein
MTMPRAIVAAVLLSFLGVPVGAQAQSGTRAPVSIFVGPQTRDGFVDIDAGVLDSIKDIKKELGGQKGLRLVTEKDHAQLVLDVLSRGATSSDGGGSAAVPIGTMTMFVPIGTIGVATVLHVGSYDKRIVFQNCGSWRYCARLVRKDIEAWVDANASAIERN